MSSGIVRAVGVEEHRDRRADVRDRPADRLALSAAAVRQHPAPLPRRDLGGPVGRLPDDDDDLAGVAAACRSTTSAMLGASCLAAMTADTSVAT